MSIGKDKKKKNKLHTDAELSHIVSHASNILTFKKMKYFLAVVRAGQVTVAARDVSISPAVITVTIRQLEKLFGVKLFERNSDGMHLTLDGERFRNYCEKALSLIEDMAGALKKTSNVQGDLVIAASPAVHGYFLPPLIARFRTISPLVNLSMTELHRADIEERVLNNDIDFGVVLISNVKRADKLGMLTLLRSQRTLWCNAHHRFANYESVSLSDIVQERYIQLTIDEAEENTKMFFAAENKSTNCFLRTGNVEAVRGYVAQGEGITVLSKMLFRPWSLEGGSRTLHTGDSRRTTDGNRHYLAETTPV